MQKSIHFSTSVEKYESRKSGTIWQRSELKFSIEKISIAAPSPKTLATMCNTCRGNEKSSVTVGFRCTPTFQRRGTMEAERNPITVADKGSATARFPRNRAEPDNLTHTHTRQNENTLCRVCV